MSVKVTVDRVAELQRALTSLVKQQVLVGVPGDESMRNDSGGVTNVELAYIHTYGGTIRIPERQQSIFRLIDSEGGFRRNGRFVRRSISNFETTHTVPAHDVSIPPRPFLEPGIAAAQPKITARLGNAAAAALEGDLAAVENQLHAAGLEAQNSVRAVINAGIDPALSPATIADRQRRGRTGTVPLIDTGQLRNSITYVIRST